LRAFYLAEAKAEREEIAAMDRALAGFRAKKIRGMARKRADKKARALAVFNAYRPKKSEWGKINFVGVKGGVIKGRSGRKGYGVYVNRNGKKQLLRKYNRRVKAMEQWPEARQLKSLDVSRARSKRAKKQFLTAYLNPVARGEMRKSKKGISRKAVRYSGELSETKFYRGGDAVKVIAKELARASNGVKSRKDFLVSIGFWLTGKDKETHFVEINRRFSRQDRQKAEVGECADFLGLEVYGFLAKELTMRGLVLAGSAGHIRRLKQNRGKSRDEWTKEGFLWEGHDSLDVNLEKIEYRIDQQSFGK
jgi:hypothetical protein